MKGIINLALMFILCLVVVNVGFAKVIYVPDDYSTIQAAVDNASAGDTIIIRDGVYYENIIVNVPNLTIKSENGSANCIVDGNYCGNVFTLNADGVKIEGFTITRGVYGIFIQSDNNIISSNNISNSGGYGLALENSDNNTIAENNISGNGGGITLASSNNNKIYENSISDNEWSISLWLSSNNNIITKNNISNNKHSILLKDSNNNKITKNSISNNNWGGITLEGSNNNKIYGNNISDNDYGIRFWFSDNNIIAKNNILDNGCGIFLYYSNNNIIYLNNFINNIDNVHFEYSSNIWNSTSEITYIYNGKIHTDYLGNYWSDYKGKDIDCNGIGDTPYVINENDIDYHPLIKPFENYLVTNKKVIFEDNFNNLTNWILFGSPSPRVLSEVEGREGVFDNNGDSWCNSGAVSKENLYLVDKLPVVIESEVFVKVTNPKGCWDVAAIGLTKENKPISTGVCAGEDYPLGLKFAIDYVGDACWASPSDKRGHAYFGGDQGSCGFITENGKWEGFRWILADDYINKWVKLKIVIREDRHIEFYADNKLIYKSKNRISEDILNGKKLYLGQRSSGSAGKAYHDYIKVITAKTNVTPKPNVTLSYEWDDGFINIIIQLRNEGEESNFGGVFIRLENATFINVDKGSFDSVVAYDISDPEAVDKDHSAHVIPIEGARCIEMYICGDSAESGTIKVKPEGVVKIYYRAWLKDTNDLIKNPYSGKLESYIARDPKEHMPDNPPYNRHIYDNHYSFLDYKCHSVTVTTSIPVAKFNYGYYSHSYYTLTNEFVFNASASYDPDGKIIKYEWDFGDGTVISSSKSTVIHKYSSSGKYKVKLTVYDNDGNSNSTLKEIDVEVGKILHVPYEWQEHTNWCALASTSMVLQYYGIHKHVWDIAKEMEKDRYTGVKDLEEIKSYLNKMGLQCKYEKVGDLLPGIKLDKIKRFILSSLKANSPVIVGAINNIHHAIVFIGYSENGEYFYIHDPSGFITRKLHKQKIGAKVDWDEFEKLFGIFKLVQALNITNLKPNPANGSLEYISAFVGSSTTEPAPHSYWTWLNRGLKWAETDRFINEFPVEYYIPINYAMHYLSLLICVTNNIPRSYNYHVNIIDNGRVLKEYPVKIEPFKLNYTRIDLKELEPGKHTISIKLWDNGKCIDEIKLNFTLIKPSEDTDGDGLKDLDEVKYGTNPFMSDSDRDGLSDLEEVELAKKYVPELNLTRDEIYLPTTVDLFFNVSNLCVIEKNKVTPTYLNQWHHESPSGSQVLQWNDELHFNNTWDKLALDISPDDTKYKEIWEKAKKLGLHRNITYVNVVKEIVKDEYGQEHKFYFVQYWFLYLYNYHPTWPDHEGDWEHITVILNEYKEPVAVFYTRHLGLTDIRPWKAFRQIGHPVVYVAEGSHASYPESGCSLGGCHLGDKHTGGILISNKSLDVVLFSNQSWTKLNCYWGLDYTENDVSEYIPSVEPVTFRKEFQDPASEIKGKIKTKLTLTAKRVTMFGQEYTVISGKLTTEDHIPIRNAIIEIIGPGVKSNTITDETGRFQFLTDKVGQFTATFKEFFIYDSTSNSITILPKKKLIEKVCVEKVVKVKEGKPLKISGKRFEIELNVKQDSVGRITVELYKTTITPPPNTSSLNIVLNIEINESLRKALANAIIKIYYNESDITGFDEMSLRIYKWNGSAWVVLPGDVNTEENYVWANVTNFSLFGVFGNKLPIANFTFIPVKPEVGEIVTFNASSSYDSDGLIVKYIWNFGDGFTVNTTKPVITHIYSSAGDYIVTLIVEDDDSSMNLTSKLIVVKLKGDFNENGKVDIGDVSYVAFMVVGKLPQDLRADFNKNRRIDIGDLAKIAYYLIGKIDKL